MSLVKSLVKIQKKLRDTEPTFPKCCSLSAKIVYEDLGFKPVAGYILTNAGPVAHSWNEISGEKIADLTIEQFLDYLPKKFVLENKMDAIHKYGYVEVKSMTNTLRDYIENN